MAMNFKVSASDNKVVAKKDEKPDTRSLIARSFTTFDPETGKVELQPIEIINCTTQSAHEQGKGVYATQGKIPVFMNLNGGKPEAKGKPTTAKDYVVIGRRAGRKAGKDGKGGSFGSSGLMLDVNEIPETIEFLQAVYGALSVELPKVRQAQGLSARSASTPVVTAATAEVDVADLDALET